MAHTQREPQAAAGRPRLTRGQQQARGALLSCRLLGAWGWKNSACTNSSEDCCDRFVGFPSGPMELLFSTSATEKDEVLVNDMHFAFAS